jgi:hypothetical protein
MNSGLPKVFCILLRALQSIVNLGVFYDCLSLVLTLWLSSPVSNGHCLQVFSWIQPPDSRSAYCWLPSGIAPLLYRDSTFQVPTRKSVILLGRFRCYCLTAIVKSFSTVKAFYGLGCQPHTQLPTWWTRMSLFIWIITFDLSSMGDNTSSYTTTDIAHRMIWPYKPHHYIKVGIPAGGPEFSVDWKFASFYFPVFIVAASSYACSSTGCGKPSFWCVRVSIGWDKGMWVIIVSGSTWSPRNNMRLVGLSLRVIFAVNPILRLHCKMEQVGLAVML